MGRAHSFCSLAKHFDSGKNGMAESCACLHQALPASQPKRLN